MPAGEARIAVPEPQSLVSDEERAALPDGVEESHVSLFDRSNEGLRVAGRPIFSVQYHPEASPGPKDSHYLFQRFVDLIEAEKAAKPKNAQAH